MPTEICALINNPENFHILENSLSFSLRPFLSLSLSLSQSSSVIYSSCEMSHFAALGYPQDISNLFLSSENNRRKLRIKKKST